MTSCAFCGRENDAESRFCVDDGAPVHPSATRVRPDFDFRPLGGQRDLRSTLNAGAASFASRGMVGDRVLRLERV